MKSSSNKQKYKIVFLLIVALFIFTPVIKSVNAESEPILRFSPTPVNYFLNVGLAEVSVDLMADNVIDMQAYGFVLNYDPTFLEFKEIIPGDWLVPGQRAALRTTPGNIIYSYTKIGLPGISGSGKLASLKFKVKKYGITELNFTDPANCNYAAFGQSPILFVTQDGIINATYDPGIVKPVNLNGSVSMQGRTVQNGAVMKLNGQVIGNGYTWTGTTASGNNYVFNNIAMDLYTVWTNTPGYLNVPASMNKQIALIGTETTLNPLHLVAGNAVWTNNEIDIHDLSLVSGNFGKTNYDSRADLNGDGKVDIFDLALVAGNFGKTSEEEYASWQP